jgi:hypothetical protein
MLAELAYLNWLAGEELTRQTNIQQARDYYAGEHALVLTDRQREFLGIKSGGRFAVNYCEAIVNAVAERLIVSGVKASNVALAAWAWETWTANRMDGVQMDVHQAAIRDGETFVMVDWDGDQGRPRFTFHPRYVSSQAEGDSFGCKAFYPNDDYRQPMRYATKRWTETVAEAGTGRQVTRQRLTVYYPDRIEKYVLATMHSEAGWLPFADEDQGVWPIPWVDAKGAPLGIPVIHFKNPDLRSELWNAIPMQDALNKALLDLLAGQDVSGFRIFFARGFYATTDGNPPATTGANYLRLAPGQIIGTTQTEAGFTPIDPPDLSQMLEVFWGLVQVLAQITDTPTSRFQLTRQVQSADSQKESQAPLLAKGRNRQVSFGNAWEDVFSVARRLQNLYGTEQVDDQATMETTWLPLEPRDEAQHMASLALKREKLSVPLSQIWKEAGYSPEDILEMQASEEYQSRQAMLRLGLGQNVDQQG